MIPAQIVQLKAFNAIKQNANSRRTNRSNNIEAIQNYFRVSCKRCFWKLRKFLSVKRHSFRLISPLQWRFRALQRGFNSLRSRTESVKLETARNHYNNRLLSLCWGKILQSIADDQMIDKLSVSIAEKKWSLNCKKSFFLTAMEYLSTRKLRRVLHTEASLLRYVQLCHKGFSLMRVKRMCRTKSLGIEKCVIFQTRRLLHKWFARTKYESRVRRTLFKSIKNKREMISTALSYLYQAVRKKRFKEIEARELKSRTASADYRAFFKKLSFRLNSSKTFTLSSNWHQRRLQISALIKFQRFSKSDKLKRNIIQFCELDAENYYKTKLLSLFFRMSKTFVRNARKARLRAVVSERNYKLWTKSRALLQWLRFHRLRMFMNKTKKISFRHQNLVWKYLRKLSSFEILKIHNERTMKALESKQRSDSVYRNRRLNKVVSLWKNFIFSKQRRERFQQLVSEYMHLTARKRQLISQLTKIVHDRNMRSLLEYKGITAWKFRYIMSGFNNWREFVSTKRLKRNAIAKSFASFKTLAMKTAISVVAVVPKPTTNTRVEKSTDLLLINASNKKLIQQIFQGWKKLALDEKAANNHKNKGNEIVPLNSTPIPLSRQKPRSHEFETRSNHFCQSLSDEFSSDIYFRTLGDGMDISRRDFARAVVSFAAEFYSFKNSLF